MRGDVLALGCATFGIEQENGGDSVSRFVKYVLYENCDKLTTHLSEDNLSFFGSLMFLSRYQETLTGLIA